MGDLIKIGEIKYNIKQDDLYKYLVTSDKIDIEDIKNKSKVSDYDFQLTRDTNKIIDNIFSSKEIGFLTQWDEYIDEDADTCYNQCLTFGEKLISECMATDISHYDSTSKIECLFISVKMDKDRFIEIAKQFIKENLKYELVKDDSITIDGHTLYRIRALKDFADVKKGDLGGYIENVDNLSQYNDDCWIYDNAKVYGTTEVKGDAKIKDEAEIKDAKIEDNVEIFGKAKITKAKITGNVHIYDNAKITGINTNCFEIEDNVEICGNAIIEGNYFNIYENAKIDGDAIIKGEKIQIKGNAHISDKAYIEGKYTNLSSAAHYPHTIVIDEYASIYGNAKIKGIGIFISDNAEIYENAVIEGHSSGIYNTNNGRIYIEGNAEIHDNVKIIDNKYGSINIKGDTEIWENATIINNDTYFDTNIKDNANISGNVKIYDGVTIKDNAKIYGDVTVKDNAIISGNAKIGGNQIIEGDMKVSDKQDPEYEKTKGFQLQQKETLKNITKDKTTNIQTKLKAVIVDNYHSDENASVISPDVITKILIQYKGELGSFVYDPDNYKLVPTKEGYIPTELLVYIGKETDASKIEIPKGINNISYMFTQRDIDCTKGFPKLSDKGKDIIDLTSSPQILNIEKKKVFKNPEDNKNFRQEINDSLNLKYEIIPTDYKNVEKIHYSYDKNGDLQSISSELVKVYRIRALKDFTNVKKGSLGGYIETPDNLSQKGNCWLYNNATVFGNAQVKDNARIYDNTKIYDNAIVKNSAVIYGNAISKYRYQAENPLLLNNIGETRILGNAIIGENTKVMGYNLIQGNVELNSSNIYVDLCCQLNGDYKVPYNTRIPYQSLKIDDSVKDKTEDTEWELEEEL